MTVIQNKYQIQVMLNQTINCTAGENMKHAYKTNLRSAKGENNTQAKLSEEQIKEIRSLYVKGKHCEFNSRGLAKNIM